jgi:hypothetical protein
MMRQLSQSPHMCVRVPKQAWGGFSRMTDLKALIAIGPQRSGFEFPMWILRRERRRSKPPQETKLSASDREFLRDIGLAC